MTTQIVKGMIGAFFTLFPKAMLRVRALHIVVITDDDKEGRYQYGSWFKDEETKKGEISQMERLVYVLGVESDRLYGECFPRETGKTIH